MPVVRRLPEVDVPTSSDTGVDAGGFSATRETAGCACNSPRTGPPGSAVAAPATAAIQDRGPVAQNVAMAWYAAGRGPSPHSGWCYRFRSGGVRRLRRVGRAPQRSRRRRDTRALAQRRGEGSLVADALGAQHPEADLLLDPLSECPQPPGRGRVVVLCRHASEAGQAVGLQPYVVLVTAQLRALPGSSARRIAGRARRGRGHRGCARWRRRCRDLLAPDLDRALVQLSRPLELADVSEALRDEVERSGDPLRVLETLVDRERLLCPFDRPLRVAGDESRRRRGA